MPGIVPTLGTWWWARKTWSLPSRVWKKEIKCYEKVGKETSFRQVAQGRPVWRGDVSTETWRRRRCQPCRELEEFQAKGPSQGAEAGKTWGAGATLSPCRRQSPPLLPPRGGPAPLHWDACLSIGTLISSSQFVYVCIISICHICWPTVPHNSFHINVCWLKKEKQLFCRSYGLQASPSMLQVSTDLFIKWGNPICPADLWWLTEDNFLRVPGGGADEMFVEARLNKYVDDYVIKLVMWKLGYLYKILGN